MDNETKIINNQEDILVLLKEMSKLLIAIADKIIKNKGDDKNE